MSVGVYKVVLVWLSVSSSFAFCRMIIVIIVLLWKISVLVNFSYSCLSEPNIVVSYGF